MEKINIISKKDLIKEEIIYNNMKEQVNSMLSKVEKFKLLVKLYEKYDIQMGISMGSFAKLIIEYDKEIIK